MASLKHRKVSVERAGSMAASVGVLSSLTKAATNNTRLLLNKPQFFSIMEDEVGWTDSGDGFPDLPSELSDRHSVVAVATGELRRPDRGEWYLKGPVFGAYKSDGEVEFDFHIARLVKVIAVAELYIVEVAPQLSLDGSGLSRYA